MSGRALSKLLGDKSGSGREIRRGLWTEVISRKPLAPSARESTSRGSPGRVDRPEFGCVMYRRMRRLMKHANSGDAIFGAVVGAVLGAVIGYVLTDVPGAIVGAVVGVVGGAVVGAFARVIGTPPFYY